MSKLIEFRGIEAKNLADWCYKFFLISLERNDEFDDNTEPNDAIEFLTRNFNNNQLDYRDEYFEFCEKFDDEGDLYQYFDEIYKKEIKKIKFAAQEMGIKVPQELLKNPTLDEIVKALKNCKYDGKLYNVLENIVQDSVRCTLDNRFNVDVLQIVEDALIGFKDVFGDDVDNLGLSDLQILKAIDKAIEKGVVKENADAGEELALLVFDSAIDFMHANRTKHPADIEDFSNQLTSEILALAKPQKINKMKG